MSPMVSLQGPTNSGGALGESEALGLTLALGETLGDSLALGETLGDSDALGLIDALGDNDGDSEALGLTDALGDNDGLSDALGLNEAEGDKLGDSDADRGSGLPQSSRSAYVQTAVGSVVVRLLLTVHPYLPNISIKQMFEKVKRLLGLE